MEKVLNEHGEKYLTLLNQNYPSRLKSIYKPPFVLFYRGDLTLIDDESKSIAIIGSRDNSEYGKNATEMFAKELSEKNYVIISGLAKGIDSIAHNMALNSNGKTIAVLPCGINFDYLKTNMFLLL